MKKNITLLLIIGLLILIPNKVEAQEYTFEICKTCEWNESNIDDLQQRIDELSDEDYNDNKIDNHYIISIGNGNYSFEYLPAYENSEYRFGEGTYTIDELNLGERENIIIKGSSKDKTKIITEEFDTSEDTIVEISDLTLEVSEELSIANIGDYGYSKTPAIIIKNVKIYYYGNYEIEIYLDYYNEYNKGPILDIDNVEMHSNKALNINFGEGEFINQAQLNIKNSDFSDIDIKIEVEGLVSTINVINSKLKKIYAGYGITVQIDCNSTFVNGTSRGKGELRSDEALNQYNIYEYQDELYSEYNGQIITSVCKKKEIKITDRVKLEDLNKELRLEIDGTWIAKPEGIIQINNNELIPLKIGKTILSKEIDGIINNVTIDVIEDNTISVPDTIKNPNTGTGMYVVISIIILAITLSLYLVMKKKKNDIIKQSYY